MMASKISVQNTLLKVKLEVTSILKVLTALVVVELLASSAGACHDCIYLLPTLGLLLLSLLIPNDDAKVLMTHLLEMLDKHGASISSGPPSKYVMQSNSLSIKAAPRAVW